VKISAILYISYDGLLEPLGQSQVLNYLCGLSKGYRICLISYEKASDWSNVAHRNNTKRKLEKYGIHWTPLRYHKRPSGLATSFDIFQGIMVGCWIAIRHRIHIVHARSYVPSVIALVLKKLFGLKFIFDMRGFWADERVDGGLWAREGLLYRIAKWYEKQFLLAADTVVSLTHAAVREMEKFSYLRGNVPNFEVITTCADLDLFKCTSVKNEEEHKKCFVLGYVGSVGVWYLFDETLKCFKELQQQIPNARLHILNRGDHDYIRERISVVGVATESVQIEVADHAGVAMAMQQMDAGIFFYKPVYSKLATAPTKLGEFLGCGIPCLGNIKVGDMADILEGEQVGVVLEEFSESCVADGIARLIELTCQPDIKKHCRDVALSHFSLDEGVRSYDRIYCELQGNITNE